jgi:hypothetical protein
MFHSGASMSRVGTGRRLLSQQPQEPMMYEGIRCALAADDEFSGLGGEPGFRVRETPEWKTHAGALEAEMLKRGMFFQIIDWSEGQGTLPLGE